MLPPAEIKKTRKLFSDADKAVVASFKVLSDLNRYRIFRILAQQPKLTVSTLSKILNISLPLTSQHIRVLANAKLLSKVREGKKVFPKIERTNPFVAIIAQTIEEIAVAKK